MKIKEKDFVLEILKLVEDDPSGSKDDIIGLALFNLGVGNAINGDLRTKDILKKFFGFSDKISYWADNLQYYTNRSYQWKEALHRANIQLLKSLLPDDSKQF